MAGRLAWGALLIARPDSVLSGPGDPPGYLRVTVRVLGVRQLLEGALLARRARQPPPEWSIAVDGLHGLSMIGVAVGRPPVRRDALRSAAFALSLAALCAYER